MDPSAVFKDVLCSWADNDKQTIRKHNHQCPLMIFTKCYKNVFFCCIMVTERKEEE